MSARPHRSGRTCQQLRRGSKQKRRDCHQQSPVKQPEQQSLCVVVRRQQQASGLGMARARPPFRWARGGRLPSCFTTGVRGEMEIRCVCGILYEMEVPPMLLASLRDVLLFCSVISSPIHGLRYHLSPSFCSLLLSGCIGTIGGGKRSFLVMPHRFSHVPGRRGWVEGGDGAVG